MKQADVERVPIGMGGKYSLSGSLQAQQEDRTQEEVEITGYISCIDTALIFSSRQFGF